MNKKTTYLLILLVGLFQFKLQAQAPKTMHSGEILLALKKLNVLGSALYFAAHPDDENTAMIAYLENDKLIKTAYLALTRGDGGQNLIGSEQRELMGLIRTQELLQARSKDGGEQFFSRANDFGYSKNAQETFTIWDKEKVLADAVWVIRKFRPDVIITRFPPTRDAGHGHHEASAMIALEAFEAAADPTKFPEQLEFVTVWQAKRIVWNAYSRRKGRFTNLPPDSLQSVTVKLGNYSPLLGKSMQVIAAESRSMHKSQGFGASKNRGQRTDHLGHMKGKVAKNDLFADIDITWNRVKGAERIAEVLTEAEHGFISDYPEWVVPKLVEVHKIMRKLLAKEDISPSSKYWLEVKKQELETILINSLGLWFEGNMNEFSATGGSEIEVLFEVVNRGVKPVILEKIEIHSNNFEFPEKMISLVDSFPRNLKETELFILKKQFEIPNDAQTTQPYWLRETPSKGMFEVSNLDLISLPENPPALYAKYFFKIGRESFVFRRPITYKWVKADEGELYRNFEITPNIMANFDHQVYMFAEDRVHEVDITLKAGKANLKGQVKLNLPNDWKVSPEILDFELKDKDEEKIFIFKVTPPKGASEGKVKALVKIENSDFKETQGIIRINYPHIPIQTVFPKSEAKIVKLDLKTKGKYIGYIQGAGDDIPQYLRQIDFEVDELSEKELKDDLSKYDAIVVGVRAFNLGDNRLEFYHQKLLDYVNNGGVLLVQYHTPWRLTVENLGPYPFKISRDRVTVEEAKVKFLDKKHPILNTPNKITDKDFENWVQERGLYFAGEWDKKYKTVLSSHDPNEKDLIGGLLYAEYGKGRFIYTGYSFFREIPAGVAGAYRLFVNLISK